MSEFEGGRTRSELVVDAIMFLRFEMTIRGVYFALQLHYKPKYFFIGMLLWAKFRKLRFLLCYTFKLHQHSQLLPLNMRHT